MERERRCFKMARPAGEASLVQVARRAEVEGVWMYQEGEFRDIGEEQDRTRASFTVRLSRRTAFTVYHIHPARQGTPGGWLDLHKGFKISYPSLEDFDSYAKLVRRFGDLVSCKVADGWGVWTFGLTPEALQDGTLEALTERAVHVWMREGYIKDFRFRANPAREQKRRFSERLRARGIVVSYETLEELYALTRPR